MDDPTTPLAAAVLLLLMLITALAYLGVEALAERSTGRRCHEIRPYDWDRDGL